MAEWLCSVAVDWGVSGSMLILGILSLPGPSPRVLKNNWEEPSCLCVLCLGCPK